MCTNLNLAFHSYTRQKSYFQQRVVEMDTGEGKEVGEAFRVNQDIGNLIFSEQQKIIQVISYFILNRNKFAKLCLYYLAFTQLASV